MEVTSDWVGDRFRLLREPEGCVRGLPSHVELIRAILRTQPFGQLRDEMGSPLDPVELLVSGAQRSVPQDLYDPEGVLIGWAGLSPAISELTLLRPERLTLQLSFGFEPRLDLFIGGGMLALIPDERGKLGRHLTS